ncbi:hypothetical protein Bca4012_039067 [Brassica carinata]|uniref:Uncharacterized protein n=1 Tax=Brassica carinata TaxID=52824 RepID=A0A8X8B6V9_BRACI|nr:hypothetical protein Bca52824_007293 [Brassica carinata]
MSSYAVQCPPPNGTNSAKVITGKRRLVTSPSNGNTLESSKPTIYYDVDKCAEAFIQNFRRRLQCDNILSL